MKKIAVVCARGLGDALLFMVLSNNLLRAGHHVTTFSSILCDLKQWFPQHQVLPFPKDLSELTSFDHIYAADHSGFNQTEIFGQKLTVLKENHFDKKFTMVENLSDYCQNQLRLPSVQKGNGIQIPIHLKKHNYSRRIIIHPLSADEKKNWPMEKFLILANKLSQKGFQPTFCMSPQERRQWSRIIDANPHVKFPFFSNVSELASFIYESKFIIGNDSGVCHLASCLGIPSLTLFARKSYSRLWRPGWGNNFVTTPPEFLIGASLKQRYWKKTLSVERVLKGFVKTLVNSSGQ